MGVGNFRDRNNVAAATVNGTKISVNQYQDRYYMLVENTREQLGGQVDEEFIKSLNLKERALDQLISETLLRQKAEELGFRVTDRELAESIRQMSYFQQDGHFSNVLYNRVLQRNHMTPEMFEQQQRKSLLIQKIRKLIYDSVKVSLAEARSWYDWQKTEINIKLAGFVSRNYAGITPSDEALQAYFDENKEKYRTGEKTQVTYISFDPDAFVAAAEIEDSEVRQYYEDHRDDFKTEKTVDVSHILIRVEKNASEETVSAKQKQATKIYYEMIASDRDFADWAKQYSEDSSAEKGGFLGTFKEKDLSPALAEQAFSMEAGEFSPPVRTESGWHIIKVDKINDAAIQPLAEVAPEIRTKLAMKKSRDLAYETALTAFDTAINEDSVKVAADQLGLQAKTSPFFSRTDKLPGIPQSAEFVRQAFDLLDNQISDVIEAGGKFYLFQVDQRKPPEVPELNTVKDRVRKDLAAQMRQEKARADARTFLESLQEGADFDTAVEKTKAIVVTTGFFNRQQPAAGIDKEPELLRQAFLLTPDNRVPNDVIGGAGGYYVIYLEDRKPPGDDAFAAEKNQVVAKLLQIKREYAFSDWLSAMKAESEITKDERFLK